MIEIAKTGAIMRTRTLTDGQILLITRLLADHKKALQHRVNKVINSAASDARRSLVDDLQNSIEFAEKTMRAVRFDID